MRTWAILTCILFLYFSSSAQKQNNNWCFGTNAGVNFNTNPPSTFTPSLDAREGVATVSDRNTGDLLFYATTRDLYNANYNVMPNGANIGADPIRSSAEGVHVVPFIDDSNKYYVFTLSTWKTVGRLSYSVVDMTLDGGLGDVVAGQKYIPIDSGFTEATVVVDGCKCYWLIVYTRSNAEFYAYQITAAGINTTPVISPSSYTQRSQGISGIKVSPDRTKLSVATYTGTPYSYLALHDFDVATGRVTNGRVIEESAAGYDFMSSEFSPNSEVLYAVMFMSGVYQYDLNQPTTAAIAASKKTIASASLIFGALQMGPDSNIYVAPDGSPYLNRISNANALAPNCVYTQQAIVWSNIFDYCNYGLPQAVVYAANTGGTGKALTSRDTFVCLKEPIVLHNIRPQAKWYEWQDGSTADSFVVTQEGTYWVRTPDSCGYFVDTVVVKTLRDTTTTARDTVICNGEALTLQPRTKKNNATYMWSTGSTSEQITVQQSGNYWVASTEVCAVTIDSIEVAPVDLTVNILGTDTSFCKGDTLLLKADVTPANAIIEWSTGAVQPTTKVWMEGSYTLTARFMGCSVSASKDVSYYPAINIELGNDTQICKDNVYTLPLIQSADYDAKYLWQDGSTGRTFDVTQAGNYHVTVSNQCQTIADSVVITTRNCHLFFPSAFSPNGDGLNDFARLAGDVGAVKGFTLRIYNRWGEAVYQTRDASKGWGGYYKGQKAEVGTYYYIIKYEYNGEEGVLKGDLTLLR